MNEKFLKIREIVEKKKKPRRIELNNNLIYYNESTIEPICYPETIESLPISYADRFPCTDTLIEEILGVWEEHAEYLRVK